VGILFDQYKTNLVLQIVCSPPGQQTIYVWHLQVGVTSLPFLQYLGDVLSYLELSFARQRVLWLGSNKALRHGLIINRITQVSELSTCLAAVLSSPLGTECSVPCRMESVPCILPGVSVHEGA